MRLFRPKPGDPLMPEPIGHWVPFLLEEDRWIYADDIEQADLVPVMPAMDHDMLLGQIARMRRAPAHAWFIRLNCFHMHEHQDAEVNIDGQLDAYGDLADRMIVVHTNHRTKTTRHAYYDMMWNRQKAYLTEYDRFDLSNRLWSYPATRSMYKLHDLPRLPAARKFVSASRIYDYMPDEPRMRARARLLDMLLDHDGWYSDTRRGIVLPAQEMTPYISSCLNDGWGGWWPVSEDIMRRAYISIYVESVVSMNDTTIISEKTLDPLVQGHFIMPFGPRGLLSDIRAAGFMLPEWIDYSYDDIDDMDDRLDAYLETAERTCGLSVQQLDALWMDHLPMFEHNRGLLHTKPYHSLHDSLARCIESRSHDI